MAEELFLGVGAVAERCGVSASTIRRLERAGIVPAPPRLAGSDRRIYRHEDVIRLERMLEQRRANRAESSAAA